MSKLAILYPGQGPQYIGMCKNLCREYPIANRTFEEANDVMGMDLRKLCFEGPIEKLDKTQNTQPALLASGVAVTRVLLQELSLKPAYSAGHSLGEYTALASCGAINFGDALKIVRARGQFMEELTATNSGIMYAIGDVPREDIEEECARISTEEQFVCVSNYNSPEQVIISGHENPVRRVVEKFEAMGARVKFFNIYIPSHCPLMQKAADKLSLELKKYTYNKPEWPVLSNVNALPYTGDDAVVENLVTQFIRPVRWQDCMEYLQKQGVDVLIDAGPQSILKKLSEKNVPNIPVYSFDVKEDIQEIITLSEKVKKEQKQAEENVSKFLFIERCLAAAVSTKNRNWDNEEYLNGVILPYRRVKEMLKELEVNEKQPTIEQMHIALEMLRSVFVTKKVCVDEQQSRFSSILKDTGTNKIFDDYLCQQ